MPWSSTTMRSQISITSGMLWSISSTPAPWSSRTERTTAANAGTSASGRPAAGSSSRTNCGSVASARATPSRRSSPWASDPAAMLRERREPEDVEQLVGSLPGAARAGADAERRHLDVLAHRQAAKAVAVLKRAGQPVPAAPVRRPVRDVAAREQHRPGGRPVEPAEHVHERRLAGAVRADQPDDLAAPELERDLPERLTPSNDRETEEARSVSPGLLSSSVATTDANRSARS